MPDINVFGTLMNVIQSSDACYESLSEITGKGDDELNNLRVSFTNNEYNI